MSNWTALTRYADDGRLEIDNNRAENTLRGVALGRKNWLFAGSDTGGARAAAIYGLIETCKLNGVDPFAYEINFTRYFYRPQPMRTLAEIEADIRALERESEGLLDQILGAA